MQQHLVKPAFGRGLGTRGNSILRSAKCSSFGRCARPVFSLSYMETDHSHYGMPNTVGKSRNVTCVGLLSMRRCSKKEVRGAIDGFNGAGCGFTSEGKSLVGVCVRRSCLQNTG